MAISGIHCRSRGAGGKTLEHWTPADKFRTDEFIGMINSFLRLKIFAVFSAQLNLLMKSLPTK